MESNNCSGYNFIALAVSFAILISQEFETDELNILAAFFSAVGDNLAIIAASK